MYQLIHFQEELFVTMIMYYKKRQKKKAVLKQRHDTLCLPMVTDHLRGFFFFFLLDGISPLCIFTRALV